MQSPYFSPRAGKRKPPTQKHWVIVRMLHNRAVRVWRTTEDQVWDSPIYEVLGYWTGSHQGALRKARLFKNPTVYEEDL